jgi:hypothetical protein
MSILVNTCPTCGAEESIDSVIFRVIDDAEVHGLVQDVLQRSLPLGGTLIRYVRLFKPEKHQLNWTRVRKALAELVPDVLRASIERNGRAVQVSQEMWLAAFAATFQAAAKGSLRTPLPSNAYVYGALLNLAEKTAAQAEEQREAERRGGAGRRDTVTVGGQPLPIGEALGVVYGGVDPAVAKIEADSRNAAPMPDAVRAYRARLRGGAGDGQEGAS